MDIQYQEANGESKVPVEITPEMVEAAWLILDRYDHDYSDAGKCLRDIFTAMQMASYRTAPELPQVDQ